MIKYTLLVQVFITLALTISGCGHKSGSSAATEQTTTAQASTVQGIAAAGSPISGTVTLCDSATSTISAKTTAAGEYSIDITGMKPPFILKSVDISNHELYSYAAAPGTVNINPLTTLAVAIASGSTDSASLSALYDRTTQGNATALTQTQMIISTASITAALQPLLASYGAATADPFTGPYLVNHQGIDDLFDKVIITLSTGSVVIASKDTNTPIFTAPLGDLMTGSVNTNNIPTPAPSAQEVMPGNAELTLKLQGDLPQGTFIKNVSFSIQLPSGITVVTPESMPATLVNYMAIPIGTAVGANIYPAPSLSATNNMLHISMSSLTGFSTGTFLTVWYIDSLPYAMYSRTPADFKISGPKYYSDIYKNHELQNLTIVPDSITFPDKGKIPMKQKQAG